MDSTRWSRRSARKALRRDLRRFDARLPSRHPGIAFTARITARVMTEPPFPAPAEEIATQIRKVLREAAADISRACDPADLASARDACAHHLGRRRRLEISPPVEFEASLALELEPVDQEAVASLLAAQRRQTVADVLRLQRTEALARELADPAAVLVRWAEQDQVDWTKRPSFTDVQAISDAFAQYRPEHEQAVEYEALELLRDFLSSFPDLPQKQMLYTVLASGMRHADRPEHSAKATALLNGHTAPRQDGGGSP
ncbi:hypothetical protein [Streptomyces sp. ID05-18]|uniref:hypothetical protein n=1 Tax=Streptomyces sp. ID05-18 TaxID=3028662 RepID=UPI0029B06F61|nr:hypothetical protein [Streptomyces sp. ID05-18]MDX3486614.1 hypothetical protein [Streptomyces sp. ID05-18]